MANVASRDWIGLDKKECAIKCLEVYLDANPKPTHNFLKAMKSLPDWLLDTVEDLSTL